MFYTMILDGYFAYLKKKFMELYNHLKRRDLVINEKEYQELVFNRQIQVNNKFVDDPKIKLEPAKNHSVKVGILQVEISS